MEKLSVSPNLGESVGPNLGKSVSRGSFLVVIFVQYRYYLSSPSLTRKGKISSPNIIKAPPPSSESQLLYEVDIGDFSLRSAWSRGLCLIKFPHPWGKSSTLLNSFSSSTGWPGGLPLREAGDICINHQLCIFPPRVEQIKKQQWKRKF